MERRDAAGPRLDFRDLLRRHATQAGNFVGMATTLELVHPVQLRLVGRDDQLAVPLGLDPVLAAVGVEQAGSLDTQPGLQRARSVVDARVDHPARMRGLVRREAILALEHAEAGGRMPGQQLSRHGESENAGADHDEVASPWGIGHRAETTAALGSRSDGAAPEAPDPASARALTQGP